MPVTAGLIAGGGAILGGILSSGGQKAANKANLRIAREQMKFQERMSNTAYQRAAKDLDQAGLNRILAMGSPASTPQGQKATMLNVKKPLGDAMGTAGNTAANTAMQVAQANKVRQQQRIDEPDALKSDAEAWALRKAKDAIEPAKTAIDKAIPAAKEMVKEGIAKLSEFADFMTGTPVKEGRKNRLSQHGPTREAQKQITLKALAHYQSITETAEAKGTPLTKEEKKKVWRKVQELAASNWNNYKTKTKQFGEYQYE